MPRKTTTVVKSLKGAALQRYVEERTSALKAGNIHEDILRGATASLQQVLQTGRWDLDRYEYPSLPNQPTFGLRPDHTARSRIPIPLALRHCYNHESRADKRWPGRGVIAWAHYLASVEWVVRQHARAPEPAQPTPLPNGLAAIKQEPGTAAVMEVIEQIFDSPEITSAIASEAARQRLEAHFNVFLAHLQKAGCTQMAEVQEDVMITFRNRCLENVRVGHKAIKTVNHYLQATRRVLKWCGIFAHAPIPRSYEHLLRDISSKEVASLGAHKGRKRVGVAETVAMPLEVVRAFMKQAMQDPFEFALMMCSWNLAAGAGDLAALQFMDYSTANPTKIIDLEHKRFLTWRGKNQIPRYVDRTEQGEPFVRMMDRTYAALEAWFKQRETLIKDLSGQKVLRERIETTRRARELQRQGFTWDQIADKLKIARGYVAEVLKQPTSIRDYARSLAEKGHVLDDVAVMTGLAKSTVYGYIKDIVVQRDKKPSSPRWAVVKPDENRVFFVPTTGRPLVNEKGTSNYVEEVFDRICDRAGIYRESQLKHKDGTPREGAPRPAPEAFILPRSNGHYIFRRSAATIAGMLGQVPEHILQTFMGHSQPDTTRKYVKFPPPDYRGERMTHTYKVAVRKTNDPVHALEDFFKHVFK